MDHQLNKFQTKKKTRRIRIRAYSISAGILLFLMGLFYAINLSPVFKIRNFNISGKEHLADKEVLKILEPLILNSRIKIFLGENNILAWNISAPDTSKSALLEAQINREWIRQSIDISIKERERLAIWCNLSSECSWIDRSGMFFENAPQVEGSLILTVMDINSSQLQTGGKISEERFIGNIIKIIDNIKSLNLAIKKITFDSKLQEIRVQSYSGPDILLSIRFDPNANIGSLRSLLEKNTLKNYKYIDLRVENRIYYKNF